MYCGIYLIVFFITIYIWDCHKKSFYKNISSIFLLLALIILNIFVIQSEFSNGVWKILEIFFPEFICGDVIKILFMVIASTLNTIFIFYRTTLGSDVVYGLLRYNYIDMFNQLFKFFSYLLTYRWIAISIFTAIIFPIFISKWDIAISSDVIRLTQISYENFNVFEVVSRSFIISYYILFLCAILSLFLFFIPIVYDIALSIFYKRAKYVFRFFHCFLSLIPMIMNISLLFSSYNLLTQKIFNTQGIINLLIETSYSNDIKRCDAFLRGVEDRFDYILLLNANDVSLVSKKNTNGNLEYTFAIGNCKDKTYQVIYKHPEGRGNK